MEDAILTEVTAMLRKLFGSLERIDDVGAGAHFRGALSIADCEVNVEIGFDSHFPLTLPVFKLVPWDALGEIPHVAPSGVVCFLSPEGMVLDETRPGVIIQDAVALMRQVLLGGVSGANQDDFADEFEACWEYLRPQHRFWLLIDPGDRVETLDIELFDHGGGLVARNKHAIQRFRGTKPNNVHYMRNAVLYLPLEPGSFIQPPRPDRPFWMAEELRQLVTRQLSAENRAIAEKLLRRCGASIQHVVVSLPRPRGGSSLFGLSFQSTGAPHPLLHGGTTDKVSPSSIVRLDRGFLVGRGGGDIDLAKEHILIVGCGSLGGRIAVELAKTGVTSLTLVDPDTLEPENTFRHVLGRPYWTKNKASALKDSIEGQLPHITVNAIERSIEEAVRNHSVRFERFDLVVFALGNPTIELRMNGVLTGLRAAPPAIYTWLEPLGVGGHALLVQQRSDGCYRCLYEESYDPRSGLHNKAAFAAPGQAFGRALSGCGTLFTPFSSIDAATTAVMATRLALDVLTGREAGNPLLSWKGDPRTFLEEGFRLSSRATRSEHDLFVGRYDYRSSSCPVCELARRQQND